MRIGALIKLAFAAAFIASLACATTPKKKADEGRVPPDEPWRAARPQAGPVPDFKLPAFQKAELKNGMTLYLVEDHGLPMLTAAVVVRGGSAHEGAKDAGLSTLTWELLDEGAGGMNNLALANAFAALGTEVETTSTREYGVVRVELLKKHADAGLELLSTVVRKPTFAQADFDRVRANLTAALKAREGDPSEIASAVADALVFGNEHPYGHDDSGTAATLDKLSTSKVKKFWSDHAGPKNAALVVVGDATLDEAKALAEKHFGKWSGGAKAPKAPADPKPRTAMQMALVDMPGATQTVVRVARAVMARGDPEEGAHIVFNEIIGGSFSSRLNLKLREEKGWTYGAFTGSDRRRGKGPFGVFTDVETTATADAVGEIFVQFDKMKAEGATPEELARAKEGYVKSMPGFLGLPPVQVNAAAVLFAYDLGPDYWQKLADAVNAVQADDVKKMAERVLVKEDMIVVLVGDRASIEAKIKDKKLSDALALYGRDGKPDEK